MTSNCQLEGVNKISLQNQRRKTCTTVLMEQLQLPPNMPIKFEFSFLFVFKLFCF